MKNHYQNLVVGGGPAGIAAAIALARAGQSVLLAEKSNSLGGSLRGFKRRRVLFDTGFHFTGGVNPGEQFDQLLAFLGVRDEVVILPHAPDRAHRIAFPAQGARFDMPHGIEHNRDAWKRLFPAERAGIDRYFEALLSVVDRTPAMRIADAPPEMGFLDEDWIPLKSRLDTWFRDPLLKALICSFAMCHGSPPARISFAAHCRVVFGLHQSLSAVEGGGDALVRALERALDRCGVEVACGRALAAFAGAPDGPAHTARFEDGAEVGFDRCVLTLHPHAILDRLLPFHPRPAFVQRVRDFQPSVGFFVVFATPSDGPAIPDFGRSILSEFPSLDFDEMMTWSPNRRERPLVLIEAPPAVGSDGAPAVSALELAFPEDTAAWSDSRLGRRPPEYAAYKRERAAAIAARAAALRPEYAGRLDVLAAASMLTFRDYLHSPDGAAYGIRQIAGQYNLFGRLPVRPLYAAGQSAALPGVLGAMMSGLLVARQMIGAARSATPSPQPQPG